MKKSVKITIIISTVVLVLAAIAVTIILLVNAQNSSQQPKPTSGEGGSTSSDTPPQAIDASSQMQVIKIVQQSRGKTEVSNIKIDSKGNAIAFTTNNEAQKADSPVGTGYLINNEPINCTYHASGEISCGKSRYSKTDQTIRTWQEQGRYISNIIGDRAEFSRKESCPSGKGTCYLFERKVSSGDETYVIDSEGRIVKMEIKSESSNSGQSTSIITTVDYKQIPDIQLPTKVTNDKN